MTILTTDPTRVDGNRSVSFKWVLQSPTATASQVATLNVRHDGQTKQLTASFGRVWREERRSGRFSVCFEVGGPGFRLPSEPAPRFSQKRLDAFAEASLATLRASSDNKQVVAILTPSDRSCGCGANHETGCAVRMAEVEAERAAKEVANWGKAALRPPAQRAAQPDWLFVRVNDPFGTSPKHIFWTTVDFEQVDNYRLFKRDGIWYAYDTQYNSWSHSTSEDEARAHVAGGSVDVWT